MEGSQTSQSGSVHPHPYVPQDLHLPGYVPCFLSQSNILSVYGSFFVILFALTWFLSGIYTKIQLNLRFFNKMEVKKKFNYVDLVIESLTH